MEREHTVATQMLLCDVALRKRGEKKVSLGDRWVNREEGGVADGSQLRYEGSQRVDDALYSRQRGDRLSCLPTVRQLSHDSHCCF